MAEIKLYKSSSRAIKLIALSLAFVLIGIWVIFKEQKGTFDYMMGWFCTCFFSIGIPIGFFILLDKRPQIVINENGIWDRTTKQDEIKWEQIIDAYSIEINKQKFISIVVDESYIFKNKQYKWAEKLTKLVGIQKLNLNLSQLKIDENQLTNFINEVKNTSKVERNNLIRNFLSNYKLNATSDVTKYFQYFLIITIMFVVTLSSEFGFWFIIALMGISAIIAKWYNGTNNNSKLRAYSEKITLLGFINLVLLFFAIQSFDYILNDIGKKITSGIENYKTKNGNYPKNIQSIEKDLEFNILQKYFAAKIDFKNNGTDYRLEYKFLNHNRKEFDKEINEWD